MKLTKQLEKDVRQVYLAYWESYFNGNLRKFASLIDPDYKLIGTSEIEVLNGKQAALQWLKRSVKEIKGKAEFRNRKIKLSPVDELVIVTELADAYVLVRRVWKFYSRIRVSTLLRQTISGWKVVQQHGSMPDPRTGVGETVSFETLSSENLQLRDAVKRRTAELENKNRELEIETALEKVRAISLGMKEPADMLEVCKTISLQLQSLGVKEIRNVQTAIFYETRGTYMNYEFYAKHKKTFITETIYTDHKIAKAFAAKMLKGRGEIYVTNIKGEKKVKEWLDYQKKTNVFIDRFLEKASSLNYYWHSLGPVALGISTYMPLSRGDLSLFNRFLKVFELAYRRYLDIEKAEAQAKEARIELALERVRARAMSMQHSDELADLVAVVFRELTGLGFTLTSSIIWIHDHIKGSDTLWIASPKMNKPANPFLIRPFDKEFFSSVTHAWKARDPKWVYTLSGREKKKFEKAFFSELTDMPPALVHALQDPQQVTFSASFNKFGALEIVEKEALTDEKFDILHRFGKVFESSYTRFNDLKKAEAQTRAAQIEVAVERVRAKALAMHRSEDLHGVVVTLKKELIGLQIPEVTAATIYLEQGNGMIRVLDLTSPADSKDEKAVLKLDKVFRLEDTDPDLWIRRMWDNKEKYFVLEADEDDFTRVVAWLRTVDKEEAAVAKRIIREKRIKKAWLPTVTLEKGKLNIDLLAPPAPEVEPILLKMGAGFDLAYRRFLDLQKAEAQAREAEIELALEKVRARGMAMHSSEELGALIGTFFTELTKLDLVLTRCVTWIFDPKTHDAVWWMANSEDPAHPMSYFIPYHRQPPWLAFLEEWKKQTVKWVYDLKGKTKKNWDDHLFAMTGLANMPKTIKEGMRAPERVLLSASFNNFGGINVASLEPLSDEHFNILLRFAKVFDQTYTRFLDLQNAEAQAREAQIELGLERVRARAMAMQRSDELAELVDTVFKELTKLDMALTWCMINVIDESSLSNTVWTVNAASGKIPESFHMKFEDYPFHHAMMKGWKERATKYVYVLGGQEKKVYDKYLFRETEFRRVPAAAQAASRAMERYVCSFSFSNFGGLQTVGDVPLSDASLDILSRFGKVFDLTYTRFNDLKLAEVQAREAQIELALERVRARTMAMQKSDELPDTSYLVFQQFENLGAKADQFSIGIINEKKGIGEMYATIHGDKLLRQRTISIHEPIAFKKVYTAWKAKKKNLLLEITGKELEAYNIYRNKIIGSKVFPEKIKTGGRWIILCAFFSNGLLSFASSEQPSEEILRLLERFAKVFDGTYTRFLDLQKAEAQARESEIQLALERVRARTMAMQKSDELPQAANLLFQQVQALGMPAWSAGYCTWDEDKKAITLSMSSEGVLQPSLRMPLTEDPSLIHFLEAHERGETFYVEELGGEELKQHYVYLRTLPGVKETLDDIEKAGFPVPTFQIFHLAYFSKGFLLFITYEPVPEAWEIFKRFAAVFEQTYTRFLDLQKAEAQAREAQIEAAMERVRSRTMAMHKSNELAEVSALLYKELQGLGVTQFLNCGYVEIDELNHIQNAWMTNADGFGFNVVQLPLTGDSVFDERYEAWKRKDKLVHQVAGGDVLKNHIELGTQHYRKTEIDELVRTRFPDPTIFYCGNFNYGYLNIITGTPLTEEQESLLIRFTKVFEMTYGRFLDLQKAEVQAREAQIELSLERVRARTMAMHKSEELVDTSVILFQELRVLGVKAIRTGVAIIDDEKELMELWSSQLIEQKQNKVLGIVPMQSHPFFQGLLKAWRKKDHDYTFEFKGEKVKEFYETMSSLISYPVQNSFNPREIFSPFFFPEGSLTVVSHEPLTNEERSIMQRFARVFGLLYRRFLDLQKAEAQAKEAQVEVAMERIRARAMAMHTSGELMEVANVLREQMGLLNQPDLETSAVLIFHDDGESWDSWYAFRPTRDEGGSIRNGKAAFSKDDCALTREIVQHYRSGVSDYTLEISGAKRDEWLTVLMKAAPEVAENAIQDETVNYDTTYFHFSDFHGGSLLTVSYLPPSAEIRSLQRRAASVFDLAFRRFRDLQKAEAQARQAQIEAALERVRSRSMGMQKSEELKEVIKIVYQQLTLLKIKLDHAGFVVDYIPGGDWHFWIADEHDIPSKITHPYFESVWANQFNEATEKGADFFVTCLNFEEKNKFYVELLAYIPGLPEASKEFYLNCPGLAASTALLDNVALYIENFSGIPYTDEENDTLMRFGKVFQQTYTRFLDLQRAEAQARETRIEAALERTRTQSMLMQHSEQLDEVLRVFHGQVLLLGIKSAFSFLWLPDEKNDRHIFWAAWAENQSNNLPGENDTTVINSKAINYPLERNEPATAQCLVDWKSDQPVHAYHVPPAEVDNYFAAWKELLDGVEKLKPEYFRGGLNYVEAFMKYGCFGVMIENEMPEEEKKLLHRFAIEFERAYTRFLDLQKAEAQAREALIEAALERVRSKAMSMHSSDDLALTVDTFFSELKSLHVMPRRCGVTLIDKESRIADLTLTTATQGGESKKVMATLKLSGHPVLDAVFDNWKLQQEFHPQLQGDEIREYYKVMNSQVALPDFTGDEKQYGHYFFFKEGGVFAWTDMELAEAEMRIFRRFTSVLSLTYKRYQDLQQAEALAQQAERDLILLKEEKKRTEDALAELQVTQKQLIQSEKMASLGELTAGIAHEIQNPLNFVNNFSEVSNELLDEMLEEAAKGNFDEVKEILNDVKQNLEKINHHGKRADGIVKGMLQHSRSSSGQKEPTDINVLADEYLRLAYHGLRAKDKSFNATMKTTYEEGLPKVNVIPQDIGRVVLNLITNAFYVVNEKRNSGLDGFEPTVTVTTKKTRDKVELSVKDNGNGIPQKVMEKIFQPFFTTKPTGQGTGLGLSLSYDIVKAHGGEIKVETEEGKGTEFIVQLPI